MTDVTDTVQPDTLESNEPGDDASENANTNADTDATAMEAETGDKLVPVTEAIRYRKRAQAAEQQLNELNERFEQLHGELRKAQQTVTHLERRQHIDALLADADAIDLDTARLLTERAVEQMSEPDVRLAVDDLLHTKPYLFRQRHVSSSGAMAGRDHADGASAEQAAERAVNSGDRRDLLDYLRLRRRE